MTKNIGKRLLGFVVMMAVALQLFCVGTFDVFALEESEVYSNEALVVDINTDEVLYHKNTNTESVEIASLTKIMTYILTVENIEDLSTLITVPAGTQADIALKGGSNAALKDNYQYTALDLLYGLMLPSGCDAADVLAKYIGEGDYYRFVGMMNEKASELGMEDTVFYSASGLEQDGKNNVSTEEDLYKMAKYAFEVPYFQEIIGTEFYEIEGTYEDVETSGYVRNTNYMMGEYNGAEYYYLYSLGGKTGNTGGAGRCLISFAQKGDLEVVAITLGVPYQHSNYHLTDHKKLFEYVFDEFTENITIDLGSEYKSVDIGDQIQIDPVLSQDTTVTWKSSDESVATVNEYGIVTGKKLGQAKITATTATGNQDYTYVSVGFYNGIDIKYNAGPASNGPDAILGYGKLQWEIVKEYGIDFAIIRAGYASNNNPDYDPYFEVNIENAFANDINVLVSFDGYAKTEAHAIEEAEYLIQYLDDTIEPYLDQLSGPIVYNLYMSKVTNVDTLQMVAHAFQERMAEAGYDVIVELGRTYLSQMDLSTFTDKGMGLYMIYRPYVPDFSTRMSAVNGDTTYEADIWQYRTDAYFGDTGIAKKIIMSALYMDYLTLDTAHGDFDDSVLPEKPVLEVNGSYVYTGEEITADVDGFDETTMNIQGNVATDAGAYVGFVTPKDKWKDGSREAISFTWEIKKAVPQVSVPEVEAKEGTLLKDIELPDNFRWKAGSQKVEEGGTYVAIYTPEDSENYETVEVEVTVGVVKDEQKDDADHKNDNTDNDKEDTSKDDTSKEDASKKDTEQKEEVDATDAELTVTDTVTVEDATEEDDTAAVVTEGAAEAGGGDLTQSAAAMNKALLPIGIVVIIAVILILIGIVRKMKK